MKMEPEMECILKRSNRNMDLEMELMPPIRRHGDWNQRWSVSQKDNTNMDGDVDSPHHLRCQTYMGLEPEMECILKGYNTNMGQERHLEMELTPQLTSLWYS